MSETESSKVGQIVLVLDMNNQKVTVTFTPGNPGPIKKVNTGFATVQVGDTVVGTYACENASFVPLPNPFFPK